MCYSGLLLVTIDSNDHGYIIESNCIDFYFIINN